MYEYQGFHSGEKLKATQLVAMEDGIINAERLAIEAASKGVQADYNENDSASASYIKNRPFYEEVAFDPIEWDGTIGDKATIDLSVIGASGVFLVKVSDQILSYEDFLGSVLTGSNDQAITLTADMLVAKEEAEQTGGYGSENFVVVSIFDTEKINAAFGINIPETGIGTYFISISESDEYVKSLSKTIIKKIDEKFLPELASGTNMEKGTGEGSSQQVGDPSRVTNGKWDFGERNPNAGNDNNSFKGEQDYGAIGIYSGTFGGSNRASGGRSFAINNRTIAAGDESFAQGYCTVAGGASSFAGGSLTYAKGEASVALGGNTIAGGKASAALGEHSYAMGQDSFVAGDHCQALEHAQTVVGRYNLSVDSSSNLSGVLFEVGNGNSSKRSSAFIVLENGSAQVQNTLKVEGRITTSSIKIGDNVINSDAKIVLQNNGGVCLGSSNINSAVDATAIGAHCHATNVYSTAIGHQSKATAPVATAIGQYINAGYDHQVAVGRFNANRSDTLFEVGGGHADDNRLNVFEVYNDGDIGIRFNGKTYSLQKMLASYFTDANLK